MTKRITALLLCICLLCSLLSGCAAEKPAGTAGESEATVPAEAQALFPEPLTEALNQALILLSGSGSSYVRGQRTQVTDILPVLLGSSMYVPAAFVAESLGGTVTAEEGKLTVVYEENTLEITPDALTVNGTAISLPMGAIFGEEGVLVPAEEYCQGLGLQLHQESDLVLIGSGLTEGFSSASGEEIQLVSGALRADLLSTPGLPVQPETAFDQRVTDAYCLTLDPLNMPYATETDTLVACAGNLYVENLSVDYNLETQEYTVSMTVYNYLGYCYGSVEVYDKDDQLQELERINPYQGRKASVVSTFTDIAQLTMDTGKALWNWDISYLNYRTDLNSVKEDITVVVPRGGYIYLTCNPTHSMYSAFYNMIYAFVQTAACAADTGKTLLGSDAGTADIHQKLADHIIETLMEDPGTVVELAAEFERIFGMNSPVLDSENYLSSASAALLDAFSRAEIDIGGLLAEAIGDQLADKVDEKIENYLTALLPVTEMALTSWKLITSMENLLNMLIDMNAVCKCPSIIIDISDWRTAYAEFLKTRMGSGDRYDLLYLTNDNLPELVVLHAGGRVGSSATIYTYQNRQVVNIPGPYGPEVPMGFGEMQYLEYQSSIIQGNVSEGYSFLSFMVLQGDSFQTEATFEDTELREGGTENAGFGSYYYNGNPVTPSYYYWKLWEIGIFNEGDLLGEKTPFPVSSLFEKAKYVSAYTSGWPITEAGIQELYFFGW